MRKHDISEKDLLTDIQDRNSDVKRYFGVYGKNGNSITTRGSQLLSRLHRDRESREENNYFVTRIYMIEIIILEVSAEYKCYGLSRINK